MATKPQTTKHATQLDRIAAVSPRYAALLEKHAELRAREEALIVEIKPLAEEQRRHQTGWTAQLPRPKPQPKRLHEGALKLVGDLISPQTEEEINPPPPRSSFHGEQRLRELGEEAEATQEAIKLLQPELAAARRSYSKAVAAQRGEEYSTGVVERIVDAANVLGDALLAHAEYINQLRLDGISWRYFRPITISDFGDLAEDFSPLRKLVLAAVEQRHVGAGKIPDWKMPVDIAYLENGD